MGKMKAYHVRCCNSLDQDFGSYWSDVLGWTLDISQATIYTTAEKAETTLPSEGSWSPIFVSLEQSK